MKRVSVVAFMLLVSFAIFANCKETPTILEEEPSQHKVVHDDTDEKDQGNSESWTGWAKDKISEGLCFKAEDTASDAAKKSKDEVTDTASGMYI